MSKPTPGPWTVIQEKPVAAPYTIRAATPAAFNQCGLMGDARGCIVAEIQQNSANPAPERTEANARLIAAAPDLLAALKDFVDNEDKQHPFSVRRKARAAINSAEGRTP